MTVSQMISMPLKKFCEFAVFIFMRNNVPLTTSTTKLLYLNSIYQMMLMASILLKGNSPKKSTYKSCLAYLLLFIIILVLQLIQTKHYRLFLFLAYH